MLGEYGINEATLPHFRTNLGAVVAATAKHTRTHSSTTHTHPATHSVSLIHTIESTMCVPSIFLVLSLLVQLQYFYVSTLHAPLVCVCVCVSFISYFYTYRLIFVFTSYSTNRKNYTLLVYIHTRIGRIQQSSKIYGCTCERARSKMSAGVTEKERKTKRIERKIHIHVFFYRVHRISCIFIQTSFIFSFILFSTFSVVVPFQLL